VVVEGSESNIKITKQLDSFVAEKLFQLSARRAAGEYIDAELRNALDGRTVVVIGSTSGIGAEVARLAGNAGADVFGLSRTASGTDITSRDDLDAGLRSVWEQTQRIDYIVNAAAVLHTGELADTSADLVRAVTDVNYLGCVLLAQAAFDYLRQSKGQLLFFTSSSYTRGRAGYSLYSSAKAAVVNLTQALADEWGDDDIKVNCINPERTATPMRANAFGAEDPAGLLTATEVARRCLGVLLEGHTGQIYDVRKDAYTRSEGA
jgi:2-C-methyl-D-erythritol 4-phosphate cytidylyltransferase